MSPLVLLTNQPIYIFFVAVYLSTSRDILSIQLYCLTVFPPVGTSIAANIYQGAQKGSKRMRQACAPQLISKLCTFKIYLRSRNYNYNYNNYNFRKFLRQKRERFFCPPAHAGETGYIFC